MFLEILQLDCGIHPGKSGMEALPYLDVINPEDIDILLISQ
jgi:cleavage and polyadenylation specificity factor subunit 3